MTEPEFQSNMMRLINQFGKAAYPAERSQIIWSTVRYLPGDWWRRSVDKWIGECRQAPLMPEIREEMSSERERDWSNEKRENARQATQAMRSMFGPEDTAMLCKGIRERISGRQSDSDFASMTRMLDEMPKNNVCRKCKNTGYIWEERPSLYVLRCQCLYGKEKPRGIREAQ